MVCAVSRLEVGKGAKMPQQLDVGPLTASHARRSTNLLIPSHFCMFHVCVQLEMGLHAAQLRGRSTCACVGWNGDIHWFWSLSSHPASWRAANHILVAYRSGCDGGIRARPPACYSRRQHAYPPSTSPWRSLLKLIQLYNSNKMAVTSRSREAQPRVPQKVS